MTDYEFHKTTVMDQSGGVLRVARNQRINVVDPVTGATITGLKQNGQPVPWITTDGKGAADWTAPQAEIRIVAPNGLSDVITSTTAILGTATTVATDTATTVATAVATAIAQGDSHVLLDADGTPYFDTTSPGTRPMQVDTDGVPYFI